MASNGKAEGNAGGSGGEDVISEQRPRWQGEKLVMPNGSYLIPIRKGEVRNPRGRAPNAGRRIIDTWNQWVADEVLPADLERIAKNKNTSIGTAIAARLLLACYKANIKTRDFRESITILLDYSDGRPQERLQVEQVDTRTPAERSADMAEQLQRLGVLPQPEEIQAARLAQAGAPASVSLEHQAPATDALPRAAAEGQATADDSGQAADAAPPPRAESRSTARHSPAAPSPLSDPL